MFVVFDTFKNRFGFHASSFDSQCLICLLDSHLTCFFSSYPRCDTSILSW